MAQKSKDMTGRQARKKAVLAPYGGGRNGLAFHSIKAQLAWTGPDSKFYRFDLLNQ